MSGNPPAAQYQTVSGTLDTRGYGSPVTGGTYPASAASVSSLFATPSFTPVEQPPQGIVQVAQPGQGLPTTVASSGSSVTLLTANTGRLGATIFNDSTAVLYVLLNTGTASSSNYTVQVAAGGYYEVPYGYTGIIKGIWASANGNARITDLRP